MMIAEPEERVDDVQEDVDLRALLVDELLLVLERDRRHTAEDLVDVGPDRRLARAGRQRDEQVVSPSGVMAPFASVFRRDEVVLGIELAANVPATLSVWVALLELQRDRSADLEVAALGALSSRRSSGRRRHRGRRRSTWMFERLGDLGWVSGTDELRGVAVDLGLGAPELGDGADAGDLADLLGERRREPCRSRSTRRAVTSGWC